MLTAAMIAKEIYEVLGYTGPFTDDEETWMVAVGKAAHAIAEKMREGVIHQESGVIDAYWERPQNSSDEEGTFFWALDAGENYSDFSIYLGRDGDEACVGLEDGQRVRVTVTREDGDG